MYCEIADLKLAYDATQLLQLVDDENLGIETTETDARINDAILNGGSKIDSLCEKVCTVPFSPIPDVIKYNNVTYAMAVLFARRATDMPLLWADRIEATDKYFEKVEAGKINPAPKLTSYSFTNTEDNDDKLLDPDGYWPTC